MIKNCVFCGKEFNARHKERKTCSHKCCNLLNSKIAKNRPKSEEWKRKIGLAHLGKKRKPFSKQWCENLSKARKGMKFTEEHRRNLSLAQRMKKGNNWKGGEIITSGGYVLIKNPYHPFATKAKYVKRSHLVMEKYLGRFIKPPEEIHHINGIKNDDRPENLKLFVNHSEHMKFHNALRHQK